MSQRVLIIDDEQHIRKMMRLTLEAAGYQVAEARDGSEGLTLYRNGAGWDVVVLDQRMAGMDGLETLRQLKERDPAARIVMATAFASIELAVDAMKLGASDFLRKPMTPETLRNSVAAALSKQITEQAEAADVDASTAAVTALPPIETITLNGFSILDSDRTTETTDQRVFTVVSPDGVRQQVVVTIANEVVGYVEQRTRRRLRRESSFWTEQSRSQLADYLWHEGNVPPAGKLTVNEITSDKLQVAAKWSSD
jgi:FixJ family two-component response regulator